MKKFLKTLSNILLSFVLLFSLAILTTSLIFKNLLNAENVTKIIDNTIEELEVDIEEYNFPKMDYNELLESYLEQYINKSPETEEEFNKQLTEMIEDLETEYDVDIDNQYITEQISEAEKNIDKNVNISPMINTLYIITSNKVRIYLITTICVAILLLLLINRSISYLLKKLGINLIINGICILFMSFILNTFFINIKNAKYIVEIIGSSLNKFGIGSLITGLILILIYVLINARKKKMPINNIEINNIT